MGGWEAATGMSSNVNFTLIFLAMNTVTVVTIVPISQEKKQVFHHSCSLKWGGGLKKKKLVKETDV